MSNTRTVDIVFAGDTYRLRIRMRDFLSLQRAMENQDFLAAIGVALRAEHPSIEPKEIADLVEECEGGNVKEQIEYLTKKIQEVMKLAGFLSEEESSDPNAVRATS
jgi:hypothetical protein